MRPAESQERIITILTYRTIDGFVEAANVARPERFYCCYESREYPNILSPIEETIRPSHLRVSFVDRRNVVQLEMMNENGVNASVGFFAQNLADLKIPSVDGYLIASKRNGDLYHVFKSNDPCKEALDESYDAWSKAIESITDSKSFHYFVEKSSGLVVPIFTSGHQHWVTVFPQRKNSPRNLEFLLSHFSNANTTEIFRGHPFMQDLTDQ